MESCEEVPYTITDTRLKKPSEPDESKSEPDETSTITYKSACIEIFNVPLKKFKQIDNRDKGEKELNEVAMADFVIFEKLKYGLAILAELVKYAIFCEKAIWDDGRVNDIFRLNGIKDKKDLLSLELNMPHDTDGIIKLFQLYPWIIDVMDPELFNIVNLENHELIRKLNKIEITLYFSTFTEVEQTKCVQMCEEDVNELWINTKLLVKKLMKKHIEIAKLKE